MKRYLALYLLVLGALAIAVGLAARRDARDGAPSVPSTFILGSHGYRAAYRLLETQDIPVRKHLAPLGELPEGEGNLLILAAPRSRPISELEAASLRAWVTQGNALLWLSGLGDPQTYGANLDSVESAVRHGREFEERLAWALDADFEWDTDSAALDFHRFLPMPVEFAFSHKVHELYVGPTLDYKMKHPGWLPVGGTVNGAAIYLREMGRGRVWFVPTPHLLDNAGLIQADNVQFLRNLVRSELRGGAVLFDEYHHGYAPSPLAAVFSSAVARVLVAQLVALFLFYVWSRTRRFGPAVALERDPRRRAVEYVFAMGELLRRGDKAPEVSMELVDSFRGEIEKRYGIPRSLSHKEAMGWLERRSGRRWKELAGWIDAVHEKKITGPRRLARLAQVLHRAESELRSGTGRTESKREAS